MTQHPKVSVIVPTHQRPLLLRRAIESVLRQTFQNFEIIVVENGQSREGQAVVQEFQQRNPRLQYLYHPQANASIARNVGIRAAKGQFIAFLDDDDEWLPEKLSRQVNMFSADPTVGLVTCRAYLIDEHERVVATKPDYAGEITLAALLEHGCVIWSPSSIVVPRQCFEIVGLFDPRHNGVEDYEFYLRVASKFQTISVNLPLLRYHWHGGNMSSNLILTWDKTIRVLRGLRGFPDLKVSQAAIERAVTSYCRRCYGLGLHLLEQRQWKEARAGLWAAVKHDPLIGLKLDWAKTRNSIYRVLRPYFWIGYCASRNIKTGRK